MFNSLIIRHGPLVVPYHVQWCL